MYSNVSEERKKTMSHIRGKDTECELVLRHALWRKGYRYRKNYKKLPGRPDICITKYNIAIFCDSEYFHGKNWEACLKNKAAKGNNGQYWSMKIKENIDRDNKIDAQLRGMGWTVLHFWSSEIMKDVCSCVNAIDDMIEEQRDDNEEE